ncbi:hypothetical protein A3742_17060 [Oleiphilus sp. HI0071]|uniref:phospholipase D-like domain-containing protein n=3 Tax=Oleiphilus TaxID=141450 RepID=UPI0007C3EB09|nr:MULTISPECIES: phospholipase D-like domain-containing protein [unclassified Oleiphilus]KZY67211.1 hypothetical protein A3737_13055 [Oleiphilus sp. HI0065]KZY78971.1 hypothetical protein A3742_02560 [Oleiphilus sp. HI0071]KZY91914.1 hypothetical protein A3744_03480 [Oleiphilus sp. HI0073]KZZ57899.1 hypothetical protein A3760_07235 [Oleiphilus sp. HI0122]KZZ66984.1 hypothetical protein A3765_04870 [Oleiphilus sp. HI0130]KZZ80630.1 hypothetical protein A3767_10445 [Oleiphilus sp. HI0133]
MIDKDSIHHSSSAKAESSHHAPYPAEQTAPLIENVFSDAESYFKALKHCMEHARFQIDMEVYIYESKHLGKHVSEALKHAAQRGLTVRLLTDGYGISHDFESTARDLVAHGVDVRIHKPLPWNLEHWRYSVTHTHGLRKWFFLLLAINKRNHRKTIVIDHQHLFMGSINVSNSHLHTDHGGQNWRDTALHVQGASLKPIEQAFEASWNYSKRKVRRVISKKAMNSNFLLNYTRTLRNHHDHLLLSKIWGAKQRILITNAYFVPENTLLRALVGAAKKGVRVSIILPEESDVFFMPWVAAYFYRVLLSAGAKIYEYTPAMLHAKTIVIDDWCTIGSSNLNHRSFRHDLEVDYIVQTDDARAQLLQDFESDIAQSTEQRLEDLGKKKTWRLLLGAVILLLFGRWL